MINQTCGTYTGPSTTAANMPEATQENPQLALLDVFFPGFSVLSAAIYKYSKIDLNLYFPVLLFIGVLIFASQYINTWLWEMMDGYLMSTADIRIDDEMYNMLMAWIANQQFAKRSRRFVANTNLNSRMWFLWREYDEDSTEDEAMIDFDETGNAVSTGGGHKKEKKVQFTPSFGTHYFWYKKRLLIFRRQQDTRQTSWGPVSEREEISVSCFGRNPTILKDLLEDCRQDFLKNDVNRTVIYRGGLKSGTSEVAWTRCVSRVSRPFSTVVLDEAVKQSLLDDMRDYLHPYTRRWYSNRGIPYRRGYLLYGPPGTGKSSLSFAIAGYFKLKIYIVSLNSLAMNEENLGQLFSELPKQCVVLLEDIDTAGLTHTRKTPAEAEEEAKPLVTVVPGGSTTTNPANPPTTPPPGGRISLSALLNILDGVASQEGRVLIMTTNHLEKLDEALIRPGRVDMTIKFDLANTQMITTIFRSIFATLEGDIPPSAKPLPAIRGPSSLSKAETALLAIEDEKRKADELATFLARKKMEEEKVARLGEEFAVLIPTMTFSPAEIQGFLLKWKRQPEMAVKEAAGWVEKTKSEKQKKAKEEKEKEEEEKKQESEKERKETEEKAEEERILLEVGV
jgi:mitochondrial chaperone BCS1